ncbi:MAG: hypothetical protein OET81_02860 [Desulfobacteraceae bacterium]|nr:hypothetical protein [Desulfobacteraceae bacterium]MDH3836106.1 hypothetical protein [Desulfobacteraceae bacterium]MDH3875253.1 hypothetical protein [Desulfobacteraceae bacterium]MDH3955610.1 hypothetical protein [Desulfobacteraceae bacterium]
MVDIRIRFYLKQKRTGLFIHSRNQSLSAQVKFKKIAALFSTVVLVVIFSGCAGVDDYLETYLRSKPLAIFECDVQKAGRDAVILLGIKDSSLIAGYRKWKTMGFFLKNTNKDRSTVNQSIENESRLFQFVQVDNKIYDHFAKELGGMELFAVYLKKQTVKQESFLRFKTLGDGELRNMIPRQVEHIKKRRIHLVVINLPMENPE